MWWKMVRPLPWNARACHRITETNNTKMETKCAKKVRHLIEFGTKQTRIWRENRFVTPARPCEPNSVMKVSSDSKGYLYLEKYNLRHNPALASRDVVNSRTCFLCKDSSLKHNLVLIWLAKKKLKCSCFEIKVLDQSHIVDRVIANA